MNQQKFLHFSIRLLSICTIFASVLFSSSCSSSAQVNIKDDGSADAQVNVQVGPIFAAYIRDLQDTVNGSNELFDTKALQSRLSQEPGVKVNSVAIKNDTLKLNVSIASLGVAAKAGSLKNFMDIRQDGSDRVLTVRLGPGSIKTMMGFMTTANRQALSSILPGKGAVNAKKYEDQLVWALEDYGKADELRAMARTANISVSLVLPTVPKKISGGTQDRENPKLIKFQFPLLELLTLDKDRIIEIRY